MSTSADLLPPSPFLGIDLSPRVFRYDEAFAAAFLAAIEEKIEDEPEDIPAFLSKPRPEFLRPPEIVGLLEVIASAAQTQVLA